MSVLLENSGPYAVEVLEWVPKRENQLSHMVFWC